MLGVSSVLAGGMLAVVSTALASLPATASKGLTVRAAAAVKPRPKANQCPPTFRAPAWHTRSVLRTRTTLIFGVTSPALWGSVTLPAFARGERASSWAPTGQSARLDRAGRPTSSRLPEPSRRRMPLMVRQLTSNAKSTTTRTVRRRRPGFLWL